MKLLYIAIGVLNEASITEVAAGSTEAAAAGNLTSVLACWFGIFIGIIFPANGSITAGAAVL